MAGDVHVERVPQVARRMVRGDVEHLEVGQVVLDLGPLVDHEPELPEDLGDCGDRLGDRVKRAARHGPSGQGHVHLLGREPLRLRDRAQFGAALGQGRS